MISQRSDVSPGLGNPRKVRILRYDRIVADSTPTSHRSHISAKALRHHVESIERWGHSFITFDDYRLFLKGQINLPAKPVILLFDQPYRDTFQHMFPVLQKLGIRGVQIATGASTLQGNVIAENIPAAESEYMSENDLLEMHSAGFEIGSCGMSYQNLVELPHTESLHSITESRMRLEILLNAPVLTFSYPMGASTSDLRQSVKDAGYTLACSGTGMSRGLATDPFDIKYMVVTQATMDLHLRLRMLVG